MRLTILNFILFQAGWFITVYSASLGLVWFGPIFSLCWLYTHLGIHTDTKYVDLMIVIFSAAIGFSLDSLMVLTNVISFSENASLGYPSSIWMIALWINLALTLNHSLGWLKEKLIVSSIFAAIGGPLAYFAGSKLGVISFQNTSISLLALSCMWAIAMPLLFYVLEFFSSRERIRLITI
ncbi:MAG: DUF2878 domain-containing protein [Gammaproteobacteria bacterium]|nr:DUF2878 domain-containing protein [Gammaproteobacteria bacterium]